MKNVIIGKLSVPKSLLMIVAGMTWAGTAIILNVLSYSWLSAEKFHERLFAAVSGFFLALLIHHFGFLRIVDRNLTRIHAMEGRRCIFSFISMKSYLLIFVMVLMGAMLRHSAVPKLYLAVLYAAIGTALFLSSVRYFRFSLQTVMNRSIPPHEDDKTFT